MSIGAHPGPTRRGRRASRRRSDRPAEPSGPGRLAPDSRRWPSAGSLTADTSRFRPSCSISSPARSTSCSACGPAISKSCPPLDGCVDQVGDGLGQGPGRHRLGLHLPDVGDVALGAPLDELGHELVELGRPHDVGGDRAGLRRGLVDVHSGGVVRVNWSIPMIDMAIIRCTPAACRRRAGSRSRPRRRPSTPPRRSTGCVAASTIDLDPVQRLGQAFPRDDVDPVGAGDLDHVVAALLQHVDQLRTESPGGPGNRDPLGGAHGLFLLCRSHRRCLAGQGDDPPARGDVTDA